MYAVIVTGGKQYKVSEGDVLYIEKLNAEADAEITFDTVLAVGTDDGLKVGKDCAKAAVSAKVLKNGKAKKITVFTYTSPRRTRSGRWVTVSLTPRLRSLPSRHNDFH